MEAPSILVLPGWQGAGCAQWPRRWAAIWGYTLVEQHDWQRPLRGDWLMQLDEAVLASSAPVILVAHGLGCHQVAAWAAHSRHADQVKAALLVAPLDVQLPALRPALPSWSPVVRQRLPFKSMVVGRDNDPYCKADTAQAWALDWGAQWMCVGQAGHFNDESLQGDWLQGRLLLNELTKD